MLFTIIGCNENDKSEDNANNYDKSESNANNYDKSENDTDNLFKKNHTITLVLGDSSTKKITIDDGEALNFNFIPHKENHIFMGWYTDSTYVIPYDFSKPVTTSFKLYAGFALKTKTINYKDIKIKAMSSTYENYKSFAISLDEFNYDYLEKKNLGLQFKISYNVKYKKDYDVPFDIGYAGSPKYELALINSSSQAFGEENLTTTTSESEKCYTYNTPLNFSKDNLLALAFSTDNVQNVISISDIVIIVEVIKLK